MPEQVHLERHLILIKIFIIFSQNNCFSGCSLFIVFTAVAIQLSPYGYPHGYPRWEDGRNCLSFVLQRPLGANLVYHLGGWKIISGRIVLYLSYYGRLNKLMSHHYQQARSFH